LEGLEDLKNDQNFMHFFRNSIFKHSELEVTIVRDALISKCLSLRLLKKRNPDGKRPLEKYRDCVKSAVRQKVPPH
jgi:hypothetical protein